MEIERLIISNMAYKRKNTLLDILLNCDCGEHGEQIVEINIKMPKAMIENLSKYKAIIYCMHCEQYEPGIMYDNYIYKLIRMEIVKNLIK